ncbi:MAG: L-histidine Nalpha-methyltransferase [Solirubrobacteraceae bacterium]|jgi:L-histidine N-alpha-methyltransferase|nr:L-histidine Nalpha-methyltransferase [Solirubrobacteraceae bacterium]
MERVTTLADDVLDGLSRPFKELPPKHFYDARGSELFDAICELPEYYPTRTERAILVDRAEEILAATGAVELVELGAGSAEKTRVLLDTGRIRRYIAFDVSPTALDESGLERDYPGIEIEHVTGDFEQDLDRIPASRQGEPRLVAFLGGTIGNFLPGARRSFLRGLATGLGPDDGLLIGTGLITDIDRMEAAYDDAAGVTAAFNRNVLLVVNRELGGDFDPDLFDHVAFFDAHNEWIEMRLRSRREHTVRLAALDFEVPFERGEEMRTELSTKFTRERLEADYDAAGLRLAGWFADPDDLFALSVAVPK